jgi:microcystin-dependent protein
MSTPYLGQISVVAFNFAPKGFALCNGQTLAINQNQALFSLLGTTYGGNGQTTFALPNLQGRVPMHVGNGFVQGQTAGETSHTLIVNELPSHNHPLVGSAATASLAASPAGNFPGAPAATVYGASPTTTLGTGSSPSGGGQAHDNMPPYLVVNFVIALQGIFPSRN